MPLTGQTFFLCLQRKRVNELKLQQRIENLGGKLDKFFSNDVNCVLTDQIVSYNINNTTKSVQTVPSSVQSTVKHVGVPIRPLRTTDEKLSQATRCSSKQPKQFRRHSINEKATKWGKKLWNIDKFLLWIKNQEQCIKVKATKKYAKKHVKSLRLKLPKSSGLSSNVQELIPLEGTVIKVENMNQKFRPFYKVLANDPAILINSSYPRSPFDSEKEQLNYVRRVCSNEKTAVTVRGQPTKHKAAPKATRLQRQYCECCEMYFQNLDQHLQGPRHSHFAMNNLNFDCITNIIEELEDSIISKKNTSVCNGTCILTEHNNVVREQSEIPDNNSVVFPDILQLPNVCTVQSSGKLPEFCGNQCLNRHEAVCNSFKGPYNVSETNVSLPVEDPFLLGLDGNLLRKCGGLSLLDGINSALEPSFNVTEHYLNATEGFGVVDPMFSDRISDDESDLHLQCFLDTLVKDNWMADVLVPNTRTTPLSQILKEANNDGTDFDGTQVNTSVHESVNGQPMTPLFSYGMPHREYDWTVKHRSDTKVVILRTLKVSSVS